MKKISKEEIQAAIKRSKFRNQKNLAEALGTTEQNIANKVQRASGKFLEQLEMLGVDVTGETKLQEENQRLKELIAELYMEISDLRKHIKSK